MTLQDQLSSSIKKVVQNHYSESIEDIEYQSTRKEFKGDITVVVFPWLKLLKQKPEAIGEIVGRFLKENEPLVQDFNVVKGFLNLEIDDDYFFNRFYQIKSHDQFGYHKPDNKLATMVEYSSPNTNKPLHLGHIRNNLLGFSISEILKASGNTVYKTQIINDRGIHISKSMLAWAALSNGETPESSGLKGDHLVGKYYVRFDQEYKKEIQALVNQGKTEEEAKELSELQQEARNMLIKWEAGDKAIVALWKQMNGWVYDGFDTTYTTLGVNFDKNYYESDTYLLGKKFIDQGLKKGVFYKKDDGSVWCDLTAEGLDEKIVLRADGTAVYITQDIGTAIQRVSDFPEVNSLVYTVGSEQDYHFNVLFAILKKLGFDWAKNLYHLSYALVDLPHGRMKSREGTVVDADDLMQEMVETAKKMSSEFGRLEGYSEIEKQDIYTSIGLGALKYFILKVDPKKRILFNPEESVDFQGNTGPFIQYTYARIRAICRKVNFDIEKQFSKKDIQLTAQEKELIKQIDLFPQTIQLAAEQYNPALIANYTYDLVKLFNSFYQNIPILGTDNENEKIFRVQLSELVSEIIKNAFGLLGIKVPERM